MLKRMAGIVFIFVCVTFAWLVLGSTVQFRTSSQDNKLRGAVGQLWGEPQRQAAPRAHYTTREERTVTVERDGKERKESRIQEVCHDVALSASDVKADLALDYRRKGLLWYSTYKVRFTGRYTVANPTKEPQEIHFVFTLPSRGAVYDDLRLSVDGAPARDLRVADGQVSRAVALGPERSCVVEVTYASQGMDEWWYLFGDSVSQVRDFGLTVGTDFEGVDFPPNSVSPSAKTRSGRGWSLRWEYRNLVSGVQLGVALPHRLNPGPWVSEVTFAAPVSLFLFFFLLFIIAARQGVPVHPMHFFFIGAAYFSFHLLLAYLVDHLSVPASFAIASAVSLFLVVSYVRAAVGPRFAFLEVGLSQLLYQVLFAATFFLESFTGLAITVLCVLTLFAVMQYTAKVDWTDAFKKGT